MTDLNTAIRERVRERLPDDKCRKFVDELWRLRDSFNPQEESGDGCEHRVCRAFRSTLIAALTGEGEK